jgi:hypothetical protein
VSCNHCGRERETTFYAILQEFPEVGSFRTTHKGTAIPIKRKGCNHRGVQEQSLSPMVSLQTVRDLVKSTDSKVIEGMEVAGLMNAKLRFHLPCNVSFEDCKIIPISPQKKNEDMSG